MMGAAFSGALTTPPYLFVRRCLFVLGFVLRVRLHSCVRLRFCMLVRVHVNVLAHCARACSRVCRPLGAHDHDGHRGLRHELHWPVHYQGISVLRPLDVCAITRACCISRMYSKRASTSRRRKRSMTPTRISNAEPMPCGIHDSRGLFSHEPEDPEDRAPDQLWCERLVPH